MGLYAREGGARTLGVYFHSFGSEAAGDVDRLALLASTVSESTTNFSMRDCLLTNMSAPFPLTAGMFKEELCDDGFKTVAMGLMGDEALWPIVKECMRCGGGGWVWVCGGVQGFGEGRVLTREVEMFAGACCECSVQVFPAV